MSAKTKLFSNSAEAKNHIRSHVERQPLCFAYKSNLYKLNFESRVFAGEYYLQSFNRLLVTENSFTLSYLSPKEIGRNQKMIKKCLEEIKDSPNDITYEESSTPPNTNKKEEQEVFIDQAFLSSIFSAAFIKENNLSIENIQTILQISRNEQQNLIDEHEPVAFLRWQEIREDLRTILSVSIIDGSIQLSFSFLRDSYFTPLAMQSFNPITGYYENKFNYEPARYSRYISKHELGFFEHQGYEHSPQNSLNEQIFEIKFNIYSEGTMESMARASYRSLIRESKPFMQFMTLVYGSDIYGEYNHELPVNCLNDAQRESTKTLHNLMGSTLSLKKSIIGKLCYHSPENDLVIFYTPKFEKDDNGHEFIVFLVHMRVLPFDPNHPEKKSRYLHPIIYDAEK